MATTEYRQEICLWRKKLVASLWVYSATAGTVKPLPSLSVTFTPRADEKWLGALVGHRAGLSATGLSSELTLEAPSCCPSSSSASLVRRGGLMPPEPSAAEEASALPPDSLAIVPCGAAGVATVAE